MCIIYICCNYLTPFCSQYFDSFSAQEVGHQEAEARCVLGLAVLACEEGNPSQALELLNKVQDLGGDEEFWYQFTLTRIRATASQGDQQAGAKVFICIALFKTQLPIALQNKIKYYTQVRVKTTRT